MGRGGSSKRRELGEIVRNYATMLNILQSKRSEKRKPRKKGCAGSRDCKVNGKTPCPPIRAPLN